MPRSHPAPSSLSLESLYATAVARVIVAALDALSASSGFAGRRRLVNHLCGNASPLAPGKEGPAAGFALLESHGPGWVEDAVDRLVEEGYISLAVVAGGPRLTVTPAGMKIARGADRVDPDLLPARPRLGAHPEVEERLRALRRELASRERVPPYRIFPNRVLAELAAARPGGLAELASTRGFGETRVRKYGRKVLKALEG